MFKIERMRKFFGWILLACFIAVGCQTNLSKTVVERTICNPLNLNYRFMPGKPSRREAADPTAILFKDEYFLFASKSGGYWYSSNLVDWNFVETHEIPTEEYAPTVIALNDTLYFLASSRQKPTIYKSGDPKSGKWEVAREGLPFPVVDPAFFQDDDGQLYLYWGCSNREPIYAVQLDYNNNFEPVGDIVECFSGLPDIHGWEQKGDYNELPGQPWIEGAWVNKYNNRYYLQYAGPGTEFKSYADGVYVADNPLGPFTYAKHNPFSYKPGGFICGAGHGSTLKDRYGNYWHFATMSVNIKDWFERRIAMFPAFFDEDGILYAYTGFGDYPYIVPQRKIDSPDELFPGWMLQSYQKPVTVSSSVDSLPATNAVNEDVRSYWSAQSGDPDEWFIVDLENKRDINAFQINFYDHDTKLAGRDTAIYYRYIIEVSDDSKHWKTTVDKSDNRTDCPHEYLQLPQQISARYVRLTNIKVPDGNFALTGFRVFGKAEGKSTPTAIQDFDIERKADDSRVVTLHWEKSPDATGYNIRYGIEPDKLYQNYMVYNDTSLVIRSLDKNKMYYFTVDVFNEKGISRLQIIKSNQ